MGCVGGKELQHLPGEGEENLEVGGHLQGEVVKKYRQVREYLWWEEYLQGEVKEKAALVEAKHDFG